MLNSINLDDKSFQELLSEAIAAIPLYSREWTNFNVSDPGITLLENLTAFSLLQQTAINGVTDEIRAAILKLLGCTARENRAAEVLLQVPAGREPLALPAQYRLHLGELCFETDGAQVLEPWSLKAAYAVSEGGYREITYLLNPAVGEAAVFGRSPEAGNSLCFILEGAPRPEAEVRLWLQVARDDVRNPFPEEGGPEFARTRWQYYTAGGWRDVAGSDETHGLLASGEVRLRLGAEPPAPFGDAPVAGCALRCLLERGDYDRPPRLGAAALNLFPVAQCRTLSRCYLFPGGSRVEVDSELAALGNLFVYCREAGEEFYRSYRPYSGVAAEGRLYELELTPRGALIRFDRKRFGHGPGGGGDAVRVVCYDDETVHHRDLGMVYGYEEQIVDLDLVQNVLPGRLSLIARTPGEDGAGEYRFAGPDGAGVDGLRYTVLSSRGSLRIDNPGLDREYRLLLCDCAVTGGGAGNIRQWSALEHRGGFDGRETDAVFTNPAPGRFGQSWESAEDLRRRFSAGLREADTAVLPSDYEALVRGTPGLCIHKVKAWADPEKHLVKVVVKPYTEEKQPRLSPLYLRRIRANLEPRRMLTTRIEICQPRYAAVDVSAALTLRGYPAGGEAEAAEGLLRGLLDHVASGAAFGGHIRFNEVYRALADLPFVERVETLRLIPPGEGAELHGSDVCLADDALSYPGRLQISLHVHSGGGKGGLK